MNMWTLAGATLASGACVALVAPGAAPEVLSGMAAPLTATVATRVFVTRAFTRDPRQTTKVLVRLFIAKLVLFAAYVVIAIEGLSLDAAPFVVSFLTCFALLHLVEAAHLRRLFAA